MVAETRQKKRIYRDERRRWLEEHERGKPLTTIANETGRNIRTINKHVQLAADERDRALAKTELYRQVMTKHNDDLVGVLGGIRDCLHVPNDEELTILADFAGRLPDALGGGYRPPGVRKFRALFARKREHRIDSDEPQPESGRLLELAREHLSQDKLWSLLDSWGETLVEYSGQCYDLGKRVGSMVSRRLDVKPVPGTGGARGVAEGIHEGYFSWACRLGIEAWIADRPTLDTDQLKVVDQRLLYGGTTLATSPSHDRLDAARDLFVELTDLVTRHDSVRTVVRLKKELDNGARPITRLITDIVLLGMVTGQCSVCSRLGN